MALETLGAVMTYNKMREYRLCVRHVCGSNIFVNVAVRIPIQQMQLMPLYVEPSSH